MKITHLTVSNILLCLKMQWLPLCKVGKTLQKWIKNKNIPHRGLEKIIFSLHPTH